MIINATNMSLSPAMVRLATEGLPVAGCRASAAQLVAWENAAIVVKEVILEVIDPAKLPDLAPPQERTLGGFPLAIDPDMPATSLWFVNEAGEVISQIENLAVPLACYA